MRHGLRALRAFAPALVWAGVIWLIGGATRLPTGPEAPGLDKVAHFLMYGVLGWFAGRGWIAAGGTMHRAWPLVLALLLGAADEYRQASLPGRSSDVADWLADAAGIGTGFLLALRLRRRAAHERT